MTDGYSASDGGPFFVCFFWSGGWGEDLNFGITTHTHTPALKGRGTHH